MQQLQTSFFYDLQELIQNAPLMRKYYLIFQALDLSALPAVSTPALAFPNFNSFIIYSCSRFRDMLPTAVQLL